MRILSTTDLSCLPEISRLRSLFQSLAMLDALLSPEWERRRHSFNSHWGADEQLASVRIRPDNLFALFRPSGCLLKGFSHTAPLSTVTGPRSKALFLGLPAEFLACLREPALTSTQTTFCIWRRQDDSAWTAQKYPDAELSAITAKCRPGIGPGETASPRDLDGSQVLLSLMDAEAATYHAWAEPFYQRTLPAEAVSAIYEHHPLTDELVRLLNPRLSLRHVRDDVREIGYPF